MGDRFKLSHFHPGAYHQPNDLWTPDEITEAGFVFVEFPTFVHRFDDPQHPIMQSYVSSGSIDKPMVCKSSMCSPCYTKTYDLDAGRRRGIESLPDYFGKKDIFKPMILDFMKKNEFHYVHRVAMNTSPCTWQGKFGQSDETYFLYPVVIRGYRLPKL